MRLLGATLFTCLMIAGCGEKGEPEPTPEPELVDVSRTAIANAPSGIQAVEYGKYCGEDELSQLQRNQQAPILKCISKSLANGDPAWGTVVRPTVEGDPIASVYVARSEANILVFYDSTRDRFGSGTWGATGCREFSDRRLEPRKCDMVIEVDAKTPPEFLERKPIRRCGRLGIDLERFEHADIRFYSPAFECFTRALRKEEAAEMFARRKSEEGTVEYFLRATEDGTIERFTDASKGGTGPRVWYFEECGRLDSYLTLRGCSEREELVPPAA